MQQINQLFTVHDSAFWKYGSLGLRMVLGTHLLFLLLFCLLDVTLMVWLNV